MKKIAIVTIILFSQIFSQELENNENPWSFYGGISTMSASGDEIIEPGRLMGFNIGIMRTVSENLTVGAGYTKRGFSDSFYLVDYNVNADIEWNLSGIELFATYNLFPIGNGNFWAGTSYAVINNADYEADLETVDGQDVLDIDEEVDFEENDFSLLLGMSIPVGTDGSYLNVGYQRSLVEINDAVTFNQIFAELSFPLNL